MHRPGIEPGAFGLEVQRAILLYDFYDFILFLRLYVFSKFWLNVKIAETRDRTRDLWIRSWIVTTFTYASVWILGDVCTNGTTL